MDGYRDFFVYSAEALALGASAEAIVRTNIDPDADFEIYAQAASAISRNARIRQTETSSGRLFHDASPALAGYFGDGRRPFRLPVTKRLKRASTLTTSIRDESGAPNQIRLAYLGAKVFRQWPFPPPQVAFREPFVYTAPFIAVATDPEGAGAIPAGGTGIFNIRIQEDAHFEIRSWTMTHDIAIPAASDSVATIEIRDETYGYRFMDRPIPVENLGAARIVDANPPGFYPFTLRTPKLLRRASVLSVTVRNLDAANPLSMRISFIGSKIYESRQGGEG